jgi:hypothetical protein
VAEADVEGVTEGVRDAEGGTGEGDAEGGPADAGVTPTAAKSAVVAPGGMATRYWNTPNLA